MTSSTTKTRRPRASTFGTVGKLPSGRYRVEYRVDGVRHSGGQTFATRAEADAFLAKVQTEVGQARWIDPAEGKTTVADLASLWLASNPRKRASTIARDRSILDTHVLPVLGKRPLASVTRHDVQSLVDSWAAEQAPSTVGRQYSALRAMFAYAEDSERLPRTPCRGRIRLPHVTLVERPELSADDLERLAGALDENQATMMWVGVVLGLRWAEVAGLTVGALDLLGGSLQVAHQLTREHRTLGPPKSDAGKRALACPAWLIDDLAAVLARRGLTAADADALVFVSPDGAPLHYSNWRRRVWRPATIAAGMPALRFHDLRSTAATALVAAGTDVKTAQTRLGHSSSRVTLDLYARSTARGDRSAADAVGAYLRPSRTDNARQTHGRA
jgi:integrase